MKLLPLKQCISIEIPLFLTRVQAGFPSPADDYLDRGLDLNEHLIEHPAATFYARASGSSMTGLGIFEGDLLIVDRALEPRHGDVVIALINGELTCKVLDTHQRRLLSANPRFTPIPITDELDMVVEGVVTHTVRHHRIGRR